MFDLYRAELRRFRTGSAAFAAASLLAIAMLQQQLQITSGPVEMHLVLLFFYTLAGCAFAALQFGSYRAPSRWIWLFHRPLHRARILAALVLAALTIAVLAVALPIVLVLAGQDHLTTRVIDPRHYLGAACLALAALSGWLAGGWCMLLRSRWAFLVAIVPIVMCLHFSNAATALGFWLACDAALLVLLYTASSPSRTLPAGAPAAVPGAVALAVGAYIALLWAASLLFQVRQVIPSLAVPVTADGYRGTLRMTAPDRIRAGLGESAEAAAWRGAVSATTAQAAGPTIRMVPVRGMVTNFGVLTFMQGENQWMFSSEARRYRGLNLRTGADAGWFGPAGGFTVQPAPRRDAHGGSWLVDAHDLYALESSTLGVRRVLHVDAGEWLAGGVTWAGPQRLLLTNRRVLLLAPAGAALAVTHALPLPVPFGDIAAVDAAHVANGTLVSVLSGYRHFDGGTPPRQAVYLVAHDGAVREVAQRALVPAYSPFVEHRAFWFSPVLNAAVALPGMLVDRGALPDAGAGPLASLLLPHPRSVWAAALIAMLLAGACAAWWTGRSRMAPGPRLAWCLACLVLGIPALLALAILAPRPAQARRATPVEAPTGVVQAI
jgi:hypothetical protein